MDIRSAAESATAKKQPKVNSALEAGKRLKIEKPLSHKKRGLPGLFKFDKLPEVIL